MPPAVHQLYYTHCNSATSALTRGSGESRTQSIGYTVRAASLPQSELQACLEDIEHLLRYELPSDTPPEQRNALTPRNTPQKLICGRSRSGRSLVARVSYRPFDVTGRPGALFAHVLLQNSSDDFSPLECLRLWNAPGWVIEDSESIPHELPALSGLSDLHDGRPALLDDGLLHEFLTSTPEACPDVVPARWRERPAAERRRLLLRGLTHFVDTPQRPIHFLAEPPFSALLFYGMLRIADLSQTTRKVLFSTFEQGHARHFPALSAQFPYDLSRLPLMAMQLSRQATVIDAFSDPAATIPPRPVFNSPLFEEQLEALVRDNLPLSRWIETLRGADALAGTGRLDTAPTAEPPPPPPIVPGSAVRSHRETPRESSAPGRQPPAEFDGPPRPSSPPPGVLPPDPFPEGRTDLYRWRALLQAIDNNDEQEFSRHFDARLRRFWDGLHPWHDRLRGLVVARIDAGNETLPRLPRVTDPISLGRSGEVVFRWNWPTERYVDHCVLGLTETAPMGAVSPTDDKIITRYFLGLKHY
ncbi:MAG: hypothetical protein IT428_02890, partial [Planctomycetaceae bacterium]|nr:hypothetical protein [Planctomycetaceae bacterium]